MLMLGVCVAVHAIAQLMAAADLVVDHAARYINHLALLPSGALTRGCAAGSGERAFSVCAWECIRLG